MFEIEFLAVWTDPLGTTQTIRCFSVLSSVLNQSPSRLLCETYPTADGSHRHAGEHPSAVSSLSALAWSWTTPIISRAVLSIFVFLNVLFSVDCWQIHIHTHVYIYIEYTIYYPERDLVEAWFLQFLVQVTKTHLWPLYHQMPLVLIIFVIF